jgi:pimeloyl-ACP methyl ester carboxylesterase
MPDIERDGARIRYESRGTGESVVLFAHNLFCDRTVFEAQAARIARRARAIAVDLRGHGESDPPRRPYTTRDLGLDLAAVLDAEGVARASVVGLSIGASAAMELAIARPERVERLVLLAATGEEETAGGAAGVVLPVILRLFGARPSVVRRALPVLFGRSFRAESPEIVAARAERIRRLSRRGAAFGARAWIGRPRLLERLAAVRAAALVVVGEEDRACPAPCGERVREAIPGARIAYVSRAGHTMTVERPEETGRLIEEFLFEAAHSIPK